MKSVPSDVFIKIHNSSETAEEAANKLGMTVGSLKVRRSKLIKKGIYFKKFPRINKHNDPKLIESLIKLSEKTLGNSEAIAKPTHNIHKIHKQELSNIIHRLTIIKSEIKIGKRSIHKAILEIYSAIYSINKNN